MTEEECIELPICQSHVDGDPVVVSCWEPTPEELDEINRTGKVWLMVMGSSIPPIAVRGDKPFA